MIRRSLASGFVALTAFFIGVPVAVADVVRLVKGGEVRGTLLSSPGDDEVVIETRFGSTYRFARSEIAEQTKRPAIVEEYVTRDRQAAADEDLTAHRELAEWCRKNGLTVQRREQLERIVRLDPTDENVNRELRRKFVDGVWMSEAEWAEREGLAEHGGRFVSPAMKTALVAADEQRELRKEWFTKLRTVRGMLRSGQGEQFREARVRVRLVDQPEAVDALASFFLKDRRPDIRLDAIIALESIGGVLPVRPLVQTAVNDPVEEVRESAANAIDSAAAVDAIRLLVPYLKSRQQRTILTAAEAIGRVQHPSAVPKLIPALVTTHTTTIQVPDDSPVFEVGDGQIGFGGRQQIPAGVEAALRAGQLPYGVQLTNRRMVSKRVRVQRQNDEVRLALVSMTGVDFGFNEQQWWGWYRQTMP